MLPIQLHGSLGEFSSLLHQPLPLSFVAHRPHTAHKTCRPKRTWPFHHPSASSFPCSFSPLLLEADLELSLNRCLPIQYPPTCQSCVLFSLCLWPWILSTHHESS